MKVWIASYPRSGNTFLRIVLKDVFGLTSTSVYPGEDKIFGDAASLIGHDEMRVGNQPATDETTLPNLIKTHGTPVDDSAAIYVVRDGRMAVVSYVHYLKAYNGVDPGMERVIAGEYWPGSWSQHYRKWSPANRPSTLLVRYEDLRHDTMAVCEQIGEFLGCRPIKPFGVSFVELQQLNPTFFRSGNALASLREIEPYMPAFLVHHRETMEELGYTISSLPG